MFIRASALLEVARMAADYGVVDHYKLTSAMGPDASRVVKIALEKGILARIALAPSPTYAIGEGGMRLAGACPDVSAAALRNGEVRVRVGEFSAAVRLNASELLSFAEKAARALGVDKRLLYDCLKAAALTARRVRRGLEPYLYL